MSFKQVSPLPVVNGGTGIVSGSAYSVVCSGTTPTAAFQNVSGVGTTGQILTSNGSGLLPTWQANAAAITVTNHAIAVGTGSVGLGAIGPNAATGLPLISQGSSTNPIFGTAVVAGGGTGATSLTNNGVLVGQGTSAITATAAGTNGQVLLATTSAAPTFVTPTAGTGLSITSNATTLQYSLSSPVSVANGGTGLTSATEYAVVCGGTTTTGAYQTLSTIGTAGQVLTSNGANALPSWALPANSASVITKLVGGPGNHVLQGGTKSISLIMWGAGGGGGSGRRGASGAAGGGGGGSAGNLAIYKNIPVEFFSSYSGTIPYNAGFGGQGGIPVNTDNTDGAAGDDGEVTFFGNYYVNSSTSRGKGGLGGTTTAVAAVDSGYGMNEFGYITTSSVAAGIGDIVDGGDAVDALIFSAFATNGGGGAGADTGTIFVGGDGGGLFSNDGTTPITITPRAAGGDEAGTIDGQNGKDGSDQDEYMAGGGGGGGGGGQSADTVAGNGGNGGDYGAGGGGGGGSLNGTISGAGGNGGNAVIFVIENY